MEQRIFIKKIVIKIRVIRKKTMVWTRFKIGTIGNANTNKLNTS